jgi:hypothetical protein
MTSFVKAKESLEASGELLAKICKFDGFKLDYSFETGSQNESHFTIEKLKELIRDVFKLNLIVNELSSLDVLYLEVNDCNKTLCYYVEHEEVKSKCYNYSMTSIFAQLPKDLFARINGKNVVGRKRVLSVKGNVVKLYMGINLEWSTSYPIWDIRFGKKLPETLV